MNCLARPKTTKIPKTIRHLTTFIIVRVNANLIKWVAVCTVY